MGSGIPLDNSLTGAAQESQILSIDRQHAQAHRLLREVQENIRKQQRSEQTRQLRSQAEEAFVDMRYDEALRHLDQAVALDDTNQDISEFRKLVQAARHPDAAGGSIQAAQRDKLPTSPTDKASGAVPAKIASSGQAQE